MRITLHGRWLCVALFAVAVACGRSTSPVAAPQATPTLPPPIVLPPPLPDESGWGVPVLTLAAGPGSSVWAGTHGHGVLGYAAGAAAWNPVPLDVPAGAAFTSLVVVAGVLWYGTAGHGFGRWSSADPPASRSWAPPAGWSWVPLNGIAAGGGRVAVGTAAGIRITEDAGATWRCVAGAMPEPDAAAAAQCAELVRLPAARYVLALTVDDAGRIWAGHTAGVSMSADGGLSWRETDGGSGLPLVRVRGIVVEGDRVWVATESNLYEGNAATLRFRPAALRLAGNPAVERLPGSTRALVRGHGGRWPAIATSQGLLAPAPEGTGEYRHYRSNIAGGGDVYGAIWWSAPYSPFAATATGLDSYLAAFPLRAPLNAPGCGSADGQPPEQGSRGRCEPAPQTRVLPTTPRQPWLQRPISGAGGNPFDNPLRPPALNRGALIFHTAPGTPVRAVAAGTVEVDSVLRLRLDTPWREHDVVVRYAGVSARAAPGTRVRAGDEIGVVAWKGVEPAALHLNVLLVPPAAGGDTLRVNPALWLLPPEGTGTLAARVTDAEGRPASGARLYRLPVAQPAETPFAYGVSYEAGIDAHPGYGENLVVSGVIPGEYFIAVELGDHRIWRRARIDRAAITFVDFSPGT